MDSKILAEGASALLDDPVLQMAFEDLEKEAYADFRISRPNEAEKREAIYYDLRAIVRIRDKLKSYVDNQKLVDRRNDK